MSKIARARLAETALVFLVFLGVAVLLQVLAGAYWADIAGEDEAAHYVTGVMVHTYLASFDWLHPMRYATAYYYAYPKVAIGHWPPGFYLLQALWTLPFSSSRESLLLLLAMIAASCGTISYRLFYREIGRVAAIGVGVIFLCVPVVQYLTSSIMAELLIVAWSLLALRSYARYLDSGSVRDSLLFAVFAVGAILTKVNGFALAFVPPIAILLTFRLRLILKPSFWVAPIVVGAACGPWYYYTLPTAKQGWVGSTSAKFLVQSVANYNMWAFENQLGSVITVLAIIGLYAAALEPLRKRQPVLPVWAVATGLVAGILIFHSFVAPTRENRHLTAAMFLAIVFAAKGMLWISSFVPVPKGLVPVRAAVGALIFVGAFWFQSFRINHKPTFGANSVAAILGSAGYAGSNILVSSPTAVGEGAIIAESAMLTPTPHRRLVRASKVLASDSWDGRAYRLLAQSPDQIFETMSKLGVKVLVWQEPSGIKTVPQHHLRLAETLRSAPDRFKCVNRANSKNGFDVYEVLPASKSE